MPTDARQQVQLLTCVYSVARQEVATAAGISSLFKPIAFYKPRVFPYQ
jgi:hypothetical protein